MQQVCTSDENEPLCLRTSVRPTVHSDFDEEPPSNSLTIRVHRAFNVYIVVLFVGIWAVIGGIAYVGSMTIIWKTRAPDNPALFFSGLIAVPIFRNTAPGNPPYGTFASPSHC
ncbi:hypothetical protein AC1031_005721 [Aphanomyces cochlioides]|nr:hypothetical protein AC1031_005721 [Aphanomyces cochlioides]